MKKPKPPRPWLTPSGVPIETKELRDICKAWDRPTWEAYLKWYERPLRLRLLMPYIFDKLADEQIETIFQQFDQRTDQGAQLKCEQILGVLAAHEAEVLRGTYLRGETQYQIGAVLNRSQQSIARIKNKAIRSARWGQHGEPRVAREFMKGENFFVPIRMWDQKLETPLKEQRVYDPTKHREEILGHKYEALATAAQSLSEKSIRALYLRYWCDFSISAIAREFSMGLNTTELLIETSLNRLKRKIIDNNFENAGGAKCS